MPSQRRRGRLRLPSVKAWPRMYATRPAMAAVSFWVDTTGKGSSSTRAARMYEPGTWISRVSPTPLLMIVGLHDTITVTDLALGAYEQALQAKKLLTIEVCHFEPYLTRFDEASGAAIAWFSQHLTPENP